MKLSHIGDFCLEYFFAKIFLDIKYLSSC